MSAISWTTEAEDLRALLDALGASDTHRIVGEGVYARLAALGARYDTARAAISATVAADEALFADEFSAWISPARVAWSALDLAARYVESLEVDAHALTPSRYVARTADGVDVILAPEVALAPPDLPGGATFDDCLARSDELDATPEPAARELLAGSSDPVLAVRARTPGVAARRITLEVVSVVSGRATIAAALGRYVETFEGIATAGERPYLGTAWDTSRLVVTPIHLEVDELAVALPAALSGGAGAWVEALRDRARLAAALPEAVGPAGDVLELQRARFEAQWSTRPAWRSRLAGDEDALRGALAASVAMRTLLGWTP